MPELKLGLNDKLLFESQHRTTSKGKAVEMEDVKFHQVCLALLTLQCVVCLPLAHGSVACTSVCRGTPGGAFYPAIESCRTYSLVFLSLCLVVLSFSLSVLLPHGLVRVCEPLDTSLEIKRGS